MCAEYWKHYGVTVCDFLVTLNHDLHEGAKAAASAPLAARLRKYHDAVSVGVQMAEWAMHHLLHPEQHEHLDQDALRKVPEYQYLKKSVEFLAQLTTGCAGAMGYELHVEDHRTRMKSRVAVVNEGGHFRVVDGGVRHDIMDYFFDNRHELTMEHR